MASVKECSAVIPFSKIRKIEVYQNTLKNGRRKTLLQIQKETGADYIINGTLYNMASGKAVCPLKYDSVTYCAPTDKYYGYSWDKYNSDTFHLQIVPDETRQSYIACSCLVKDFQAVEKPIYNAAQGGKRGRTAIGTTIQHLSPALCLFVSSDAYSTAKRTPYTLASYMVGEGWKDGVMLDCGGSSQGYFNGKVVQSSRRCAHYICIYLNKERKNDSD